MHLRECWGRGGEGGIICVCATLVKRKFYRYLCLCDLLLVNMWTVLL